MATLLHLYRAQQRRAPAPLQPDAAARLSGADCAVIAGDKDQSEREEAGRLADRLLIAAAIGFALAAAILIARWIEGI